MKKSMALLLLVAVLLLPLTAQANLSISLPIIVQRLNQEAVSSIIEKCDALIAKNAELNSIIFQDVYGRDVTFEDVPLSTIDYMKRLCAIRQQVLEYAQHFEGVGTTILPDVCVDNNLMRAFIRCDDEIKYTIPGMVSFIKSETASIGKQILLQGPVTGDIYIEGAGAWTLDIEPLLNYGEMSSKNIYGHLSGAGSYVSDYFQLDKPLIVTITATSPNNYEFFTATLNYKPEYYTTWIGSRLAHEYLAAGETVTSDVILKPESKINMYLYTVDCAPDVEWSITLKQ